MLLVKVQILATLVLVIAYTVRVVTARHLR